MTSFLGRMTALRGSTAASAMMAGNVAIVFALMAVVLMLAIGAAVDVGRWLHARDQTVAAIDAAVLAGGRALQTNSTDKSGCRRSGGEVLQGERHLAPARRQRHGELCTWRATAWA